MIKMDTMRNATEADLSNTDADVDDSLLAALPAQSRRREVWVGLFVIVAALSVLTALFTLTDAAMFRGRYIITTVVDDAGGIRKGDPVQMRGVNIGRVQKFGISSDGVAVRLELYGEYKVPKDSRVVLRSGSVLGGMTAEIIPGSSTEMMKGGDVIPGVRAEGIFDVAGQIGDRADVILAQVDRILTDQTVESFGESALQLRVLLGELAGLAAEQRRELGELSGSLRRAVAGVERATDGPELERAVAQLDEVMERMGETSIRLASASASLESILGRMDRGEGTLGRLSTDESLYVNLDKAVRELNALMADFRENPTRYINLKIF